MPGVTIILDEATPLLDRVQTAAAAQGIALVAARAVGGLVKEHLYGLDSQRHRFGNHFYRQAADSVTTGVLPQGAVVSITQTGFRQRLFGGTIRAKNVRNLAIPASPEAYGKRPREFSDLDFAIVENPDTGALQPALVRRAQTVIKHRRVRTKEGITFRATGVMSLLPEIMFWLTPSVDQEADPSVLPYREQMKTRAMDAVQTRINRLVTRQLGGGQS
jgi:hypothetical protein